LKIIQIKALNRSIYSHLESQRKNLEEKRESVDKLLLFYENLKYKQSYLRRQIRVCKDLSTPILNDIESEINEKIGTTSFESLSQLEKMHRDAIETLENEKAIRREMQDKLTHLETKHQTLAEKMDKKRKFLDELPARVSMIKVSTVDLNSQFNLAIQDI
jgi:chromosome segregation ATPase